MKKLILIRGPPAAGKSTLSILLAKKLKEKVFIIPTDSINFGFHFINLIKRKNNALILSLLSNLYLKKNTTVIVEGLFGGENPRKKINALKKIAKNNRAKFYLINIKSSLETSILRDSKRSKHISQKAVKKWSKHHYISLVKEGLALDNNKLSKTKAINEILKYIKNN